MPILIAAIDPMLPEHLNLEVERMIKAHVMRGPRTMLSIDFSSHMRRLSQGKRVRLAVVLAASVVGLMTFSGETHAQDELEPAESGANRWDFTVGVGALNASRYPGSRYDYTRVIPMIDVLYGRFFLGALPDAGAPAGLGVNIVQNQHWRFGAGLEFDSRKPRYASDDPILHGWGDIPSTERGFLFGGYSLDWFSVRGEASQDIGGKHEGLLASLAMEGRIHPIAGLTLSAGPEVAWANRQYTQTFFGVDTAQSAIARIPEYTVKGGVENWRFGVGAQYSLTPKWTIGAQAAYGKYVGDAADSPVTTDKNLRTFGLFSIYHF
ncbi:MAG: MipA/OmpV family protein [Steroidobacteraceae bacterium]